MHKSVAAGADLSGPSVPPPHSLARSANPAPCGPHWTNRAAVLREPNLLPQQIGKVRMVNGVAERLTGFGILAQEPSHPSITPAATVASKSSRVLCEAPSLSYRMRCEC